ncbi:MAG: geranylgeranylglyceryl/heptaprenylglyceryl phosphate synthase [Wenyingzhuangia sp.]|jgi:phosphoglycerol geranylgeranyltransferase|uniref:geranylgeranylglyceryl/heptaprenylglyceryl phosphate synthase n=1 Tax=Wenyingzhuangia sp. TaxID=1964193 RepID=UPI0032194C41
MSFLKTLQTAQLQNKKLVAVLIDPDKVSVPVVDNICKRINKAPVDYLLLGGSIVGSNQTEIIAKEIQKHTTKPVILFPGDYTHLTEHADALLFLNLISGNNPEYLIHQQVKAAPLLRKTSLEVVSTGYILINEDNNSSTLNVTKTKPIDPKDTSLIKNTALAGQLMGQKVLYLEAGSGSKQAIEKTVINAVHKTVHLPIIVGGGIKDKNKIHEIHKAGATLVVIGTAFELNRIF